MSKISEAEAVASEAPEFEELFGRAPDARADAPGRVNLMGEHTDYNGGLVLPMAIPQRTRVELAANGSDRARLWSTDFRSDGIAEFRLGEEKAGAGWIDYVQGVADALRAENFEIEGFDARIETRVPLGAGLSSSAALEVALLRGLRALFEFDLDDVLLAKLGQRAEVDFVGARVGIMDQMAASLADETTALLIDTRDLNFRKVPLPAGAEIAVINSGVGHRHAGGDYNRRREECGEAARLAGVEFLTDLDPDDARLDRLPEPLRGRARHVVLESLRVEQTVLAFETGDLAEAGRLFRESHESQRNLYQVSIPQIDWLVEEACRQPEVFGARLTGGGFGGSIVVLAQKGTSRRMAERISAAYRDRFDLRAAVLVPQA